MSVRPIVLFLGCLLPFTCPLRAQLQDRAADTVRVTVSVNQDGSRTSYEFDRANRKAVATTTSANGKPLSKIRYDLDDAGRFAAGEVYGPDGKLRFKTLYKHDPSGRLLQETQLSNDGAVAQKLVYSYDEAGKQTGYAVYDSAGKLLGQTSPVSPSPTPTRKKER